MVVVSRQVLVESNHSSVICAPIGTASRGLFSEVLVGPDEGLKFVSAIHCDDLISVGKAMLTNYVGSLTEEKQRQLDNALAFALGITS